MQKPGGLTAQEKAAAEKALSGIKLSEAQNAALVRPQIEAAEKTVAVWGRVSAQPRPSV